ncbi:MAG: AAA family ATPase, partial [Planctomycetota bacterium]
DTLASTVARLTATLEARSAADASRASRLAEAETELDDAQKASADARARLATHVADVDQASASVDVCETTLASVEERVTNVAERLGELTQERDDLERERAAYVARREALDAVERRRDGVGDATRELLADEARKLVADCVTVDAEWASAVEAAAADRLEAVIVADVASLEVDGPVHVVSHDTIAATERAGRPAAEVIRPRSAADSAVAVWLAHDLRLVDQLPAEPTPGVTFATRDGRVLRGDGLLRLGPVGSGSLARRAELDQLVDDLDQLDGQLAQRRETLDTVELDHAAVSRERDGAADALAAARESFASATQERDALDRESARLTAAVSQSQRRVDVLRQEATDVQSSTDALQRELDQATEEASAVDASLATARDTAAEATHGVEQAVTTMSDTRLHLARLDERRRAVQAAAQASRDRREAIERQREAIAQRRVQLTSLIVELEAAVEQAKAVVDEANADLSAAPNPSELDASLAERTHQTNAAREAAANAELRHRQAEDAVRQARDAQSRRDRDATAAELRLETHVTRSFEEHDLSTEDLAAEVEALLVEEPKDDAELIELRGRIARLGPVDPDADTKLAEIEARQVDVADQARDVRQAVAELRRLIAGLDEERDKRFAETFEAVKGHFGGLFRKLFGGGRAELSLTEPAEDDDTPPGVEVTASPPGKRPVRMSQLSGGEKSMASVALLMSLFRARPGPFCILDEVDAALDEANTQRFCHLLDDFIGETQFVVVTHAKPTMRSADVLFGVTMPDRGISRRVEVRFGPKDEVVTDAGVLELA